MAGQQNADGGFNVGAGGQQGSDLRASTQAVSGAVGTSFGVLFRDLGGVTSPSPSPTTTATTSAPSVAPTSSAAPADPAGADPGTGLAATGAEAGGPALVAGVLLIAGMALMVAARLHPRTVAARRH